MLTDTASVSIQSAERWCKLDLNPTTRTYVRGLLDLAQKRVDGGAADLDGAPAEAEAEAERELLALFPADDSRIGFGTAGLRSEMKPGPLGMNDLTVVQAAQGLARYLLGESRHKHECNMDSAAKNGVTETGSATQREQLCAVVGYDHRSNMLLNISSLSFAIITAIVFAEVGIKCILLDGYSMTPLVPFVLQQVGAVGGIMVTASHNPKKDAGYKIYARDGCQIRSPMDKLIAAEIERNLVPWTDYRTIIERRRMEYKDDPCLGLSCPELTKQMLDKYYTTLKSSGLCTRRSLVSSLSDKSMEPPKFAYTALHGVGQAYATRVFETFEIPPFGYVLEQSMPDPSFPTVAFPNPEERSALALGMQFAAENGYDILLANDPDADRLAVSERDRETGEWTQFSGDQIGAILGLWLWEQVGRKSEKPVVMCASTVSSRLLSEIARVEGFRYEETLTGFKWTGSRAAYLSRNEGYLALFSYEESIGFCCGDLVFDKDGISALGVFAELTLAVYEEGRTLKEHLQGIYDRYGEFVSQNGYFFLPDPKVASSILERIRCGGSYNPEISPYVIEWIRDLGDPGFDSSSLNKQPSLPISKGSPMITIRLTNGCTAQFRASGTEPKFKYYFEMKGEPGVSREDVSIELRATAAWLMETLIQPERYQLKKR